MKLRHQIRGHDKPEFTAALDELGIRYKATMREGIGGSPKRAYFELFVYDDDPNWQKLRDLVAEHDVKVLSSASFTSTDIASADWLLAHATADAGYPRPENCFGHHPESFDFTHYCRRCGIGLMQKGPIRLKGEPRSKTAHFFAPQWMHQVLLARHDVREVFEAEGVSGARFLAPLKHRTGAPLETIVQIVPTTTLKEGLLAVVQEQVTCSPYNDKLRQMPSSGHARGRLVDGYCGRMKFHVPYGRRFVHYSRSVLDAAPDVVLSAEWFGSGAAAAQQVVVSSKVARLCLKHEWKGLELEPIQLV